MQGGWLSEVDLTRPWWRFWAFVLPGVLSFTVFEHDGTAVGVVALVALCVVFWPMAFAPVAYESWSRSNRVVSTVLAAVPVGFPAFTLWFPETSLGARVLMCVGFGVAAGLIALLRGGATGERSA